MNWLDCKLGDIVTLKCGHGLPKEKRKEGNIPVISSSGFTGTHNEAKAEPPGVVTGRYGTLGKVFFVDEPYWPHNTSLYVTDFHNNEPRFVAYFLAFVLKNYKSDKAAVPGVNRHELHKIQVKKPDLQTQKKAAKILSSYDDLIENNQQRIALLEESARLFYREWFGVSVFSINSQKPVFLSEIAEISRGRAYTSKEIDTKEGFSFVNLKCINKYGGFKIDGIKKISGDFKTKHYICGGEIVMALTDMTREALIVGRSALLTKLPTTPAIFSMDLLKISPKNKAEKYWLYSMLRFSDLPLYLREKSSGTTVLHLKQKHVEMFPGKFPDENKREKFSTLSAPIFKKINALMLMNIKLAKSRDLLLPRLMSGRINL